MSSVKEGLQSYRYCNKVYSRSSFNKMWILKYSPDLLDNFNSREVHLSKKPPQQFTNHSSWKCINTFKEIICNAVSYKMVTKVTNKGNNKITELQTVLQRESQNSYVYKQTKSVNNRKTVKTVMTLTYSFGSWHTFLSEAWKKKNWNQLRLHYFWKCTSYIYILILFFHLFLNIHHWFVINAI